MKKILALTFLTLVFLNFGSVGPALAAPEVQKQVLPTSPLYLLVKAKEAVQQFLTFNQTSKAKLLEGFAEQRTREMDYASFSGDNDALNLSLDRYQTQKTRALEYAEGTGDSLVVNQIKEGTLEQQKVMTKMQLEVEGSESTQQRIVEVQKDVATETKKTVEIVQGTKEGTEIDEKIHYIWLDPNIDASGKLPPLPDEIGKWEYAPGTEGRDETDRVVEFTMAPGTEGEGKTGNKLQIRWAPGTEGEGKGEVQYEGGPKIVIQSTAGEDSGGSKKIEIKQAPGTGKENTKVEIEE